MNRPLRLTDHAAVRARERLGLGEAEALAAVEAAPIVPEDAWKLITAARHHRAHGAALRTASSGRYAGGFLWVVHRHRVVTVYEIDSPGLRTLLDRVVGR